MDVDGDLQVGPCSCQAVDDLPGDVSDVAGVEFGVDLHRAEETRGHGLDHFIHPGPVGFPNARCNPDHIDVSPLRLAVGCSRGGGFPGGAVCVELFLSTGRVHQQGAVGHLDRRIRVGWQHKPPVASGFWILARRDSEAFVLHQDGGERTLDGSVQHLAFHEPMHVDVAGEIPPQLTDADLTGFTPPGAEFFPQGGPEDCRTELGDEKIITPHLVRHPLRQ